VNHWTGLSIELANQRDYLDQLFRVYPLTPEIIRDVDKTKWDAVERAFGARDQKALIKALLGLELFPIKDSYVAYLRRDKGALDRNPATVSRLAGRMFDMGIDELWKRASEPKETNRQIGPLFRNWVNSGALGVDSLEKDEFLKTTQNAVLRGSDASLKEFAREHLNYHAEKGIDFVAKFNGKYVLGEAKFLTDFGGHQDRQLEDVITLLKSENVDAITIGIVDGVLYIPNGGSMHRILLNNAGYNIMSSLLLRDFLYQL
jgi:hypothetical protein